MAVEVKYIVVRDGVEKMTFTSKKEADAYDKQLDIADNLLELLQGAELTLDEESLDTLAFYLAQNAADAVAILKGGTPKPKAEKKPQQSNAPSDGDGRQKAESPARGGKSKAA